MWYKITNLLIIYRINLPKLLFKDDMIENIDMFSATAKAKRLKSARALADLSRKQIEKLYNISENTLRLWENPCQTSNGLSEKGAARAIEMLRKAGVSCSIEWLLYGSGNGPKTYNQIQNDVVAPIKNIIHIPEVKWDDEIIFEEIETFRHLNPDPIAIIIPDDGMEPLFQEGNYVGGNKRYGSEIEKLVGSICIIETIDCMQLCRRLDKDKSGKYILSCLNPLAHVEQPVLYGVKLHSASQVIWIRKKESFFLLFFFC
jgi:transcriptional regulator with XRE-family HTH domain